MRKLFTLLFIAVTVPAVWAGGGKVDVGIALPETHVERWQRDGAKLREVITSQGYAAEVAYADADQAKQNRQIEDFITKGARLIILGSINEGAAEAVAKAAEEGVIVIAYGRLITGTDKYDYYIAFDNFKVGEFQGQAIIDALELDKGGKYNIALFSGAPTDNNSRLYFDAAMSRLRPYIQNGTLTIHGPAPMSSNSSEWSKTTTENWLPEKAQTRMENLLIGDLKGVTLDAVLAPNDTLARAIITALESDAKYVDKLPVVTGQDGELLTINWILNGKQYMTVFKDTRNLAEAAGLLADAIMKGEEPSIPGARVDKETYNTGLKVVTSYLLEPVNVTEENYKEVLVKTKFYTESQIKKGQ